MSYDPAPEILRSELVGKWQPPSPFGQSRRVPLTSLAIVEAPTTLPRGFRIGEIDTDT
jgi:hypothetical protein